MYKNGFTLNLAWLIPWITIARLAFRYRHKRLKNPGKKGKRFL